MSEIDNVRWTAEIAEREWFKSQLFHTGYEVHKAAAVGLLRTVKTHWRATLTMRIAGLVGLHRLSNGRKALFCKQTYPELVKFGQIVLAGLMIT